MVNGPVRRVGFALLLSNRAPPNRFHSLWHEGSRQKAKPPRSPLRVSKKLKRDAGKSGCSGGIIEIECEIRADVKATLGWIERLE